MRLTKAEALRQARLDALEEAAKAVEATRDDDVSKFVKDKHTLLYGWAMASDCAAAIRALRDKA